MVLNSLLDLFHIQLPIIYGLLLGSKKHIKIFTLLEL